MGIIYIKPSFVKQMRKVMHNKTYLINELIRQKDLMNMIPPAVSEDDWLKTEKERKTAIRLYDIAIFCAKANRLEQSKTMGMRAISCAQTALIQIHTTWQ